MAELAEQVAVLSRMLFGQSSEKSRPSPVAGGDAGQPCSVNKTGQRRPQETHPQPNRDQKRRPPADHPHDQPQRQKPYQPHDFKVALGLGYRIPIEVHDEYLNRQLAA